MKENNKRVYKLSAILLVLCLITACVIGTTLAKYTTGDNGTDSAQVAKWGVKVEIQGDDTLFSNEYENDADPAVKTVISSNTNIDVVAPGAASTSALKFAISGTPEVSARIEFNFTATKDVFLKAATHTDPIEGKTVTVAADYHPIVFTLKQTKNATGAIDNTLATGTLEDIKTAINALNTNCNPNTNLQAEYELTWAWAFDGNDSYDTLLGNFIADPAVDGDNVSTALEYSLSITVTQID